ncbi:unnamed protein product, partial [Pneumocystis jirovecii]
YLLLYTYTPIHLGGSYPLLDGSGKKVLYVQFPPLKGPIMERWDLLKHHDVFLHYLLSSFPYGSEYTMIYVSTPGLTMDKNHLNELVYKYTTINTLSV